MQPLTRIEAHPWAIAILTPFIAIFLWAAWLELRRWWQYGPAENSRGQFPIDTNAPSYEMPPARAAALTQPDDKKDRTPR